MVNWCFFWSNRTPNSLPAKGISPLYHSIVGSGVAVVVQSRVMAPFMVTLSLTGNSDPNMIGGTN